MWIVIAGIGLLAVSVFGLLGWRQLRTAIINEEEHLRLISLAAHSTGAPSDTHGRRPTASET
jgi:hypothetical protein